MRKRIPLLLVAALFLVFAVTAVGCGGDDSSSGSGDSPSGGSGGGNAPDNVDEAVDKCLAEAEKAPDGNAKDAAKKLCNAARSQDPEKIKNSAREACLDLSKQIPSGDQRDQAEAACKDGTK